MRVVSLDGPAKAGKTCIGTELAEQLSGDYSLEYHVAGDFFRSVTAAVIEEHRLEEDEPLPDEAQLDQTIDHVLTSSRLYGGDWGDLQRPEVNTRVSVIGSRAITQAAADGWWQRISHGAFENGAELLIVDGRNPRQRLLEPLRDLGKNDITLDLFVTCTVNEAARRILAGKPYRNFDPTSEELATEAANVNTRRNLDIHRTTYPFIEPFNPVVVNGQSAEMVVMETLLPGDETAPLPRSAYFDTTGIDKTSMQQRAVDISLAALRIVSADEVAR
jgi:cytidylate kinase